MKILIAVTDCDVGGITTAAYNLCNELYRRGHNVTLLDMSNSRKAEDFLPESVEKKYLSGLSKYWKLTAKTVKQAKGFKKLFLLGLASIKKLSNRHGLWHRIIFRRIKDERYDVSIAFRQCAPCYYFVLKKIQAAKKLAFIHGDVQFMGGNEKSFLPYMDQFDKVAYVSDAVKEGFVAAYPSLAQNAITIYNILDFNFIIQSAQAQGDVVFDENKINIVTVSRIENASKGTDRIVWVCKKLKEHGIVDFSWYVIGDGPDYVACVQQAKEFGLTDELYFLGSKENPYPYIRQSDFSVLPTKGESFGLVVLESLILHKPVVVCEYPALKELFEDDVTGRVTKQDVESLYEAIYTMITDRAIREKYTLNCSHYEYTADQAYQQFMAAVEA